MFEFVNPKEQSKSYRKPAPLKELAYARGNQEYIAPGQEKPMIHESGHVVLQRQGYTSPNVPGTVIQLYHQVEGYKVGRGTTRYMQCDGDDGAVAVGGDENSMAFLYETMVYDSEAQNVIDRFSDTFHDPPERNDVALSLVVNHKVGDNKISRDNLVSVGMRRTPLIHIERAVWGMGSGNEEDSPGGHPAEEQIPYYSLRRRAAVNPGAVRLEAALKSKSTRLWHRMCDSDVVFKDPRVLGSRQVNILAQASGQDRYANVAMVTFGYVLKTPPGKYDAAMEHAPWFTRIKNALPQAGRGRVINDIKAKVEAALEKYIAYIYYMEAEFRQVLHHRDAAFGYYPCEPSTYYRMESYEREGVWEQYQEQQIAEGQNFKSKLVTGDKLHAFVSIPEAMEETGAGKRHDSLVSKLLENGNVHVDMHGKAICFRISKQDLYAEIKKLNQSYFNQSTHCLSSQEQAGFDAEVDHFLDEKRVYEKLREECVVRW